MTTIQVGTTLTTRSACDHDTVFSCTVVKRTDKRATVIVDGETKICGIKSDADGEYIMPMGRYSMAPIFRAI